MAIAPSSFPEKILTEEQSDSNQETIIGEVLSYEEDWINDIFVYSEELNQLNDLRHDNYNINVKIIAKLSHHYCFLNSNRKNAKCELFIYPSWIVLLK